MLTRNDAARTLAQRRELIPRLPWHWTDRLIAAVLLLLVPLMYLSPLLLADLADTVIGDVRVGEMWLSPVLLAVLRLGVLVFAGQAVIRQRAASWWARGPVAVITLGMAGNWARDRMYDTPLTLSFLLLLTGLALLVWRLLVMDGETVRRKRAEQIVRAQAREVSELRAEVARLKGEIS